MTEYIIHTGDCREILPDIRGIDLCITSPPFWMRTEFLTREKYLCMLKEAFLAVHESLSPNGLLWWIAGWGFDDRTPEWMSEQAHLIAPPFNWISQLVLVYQNADPRHKETDRPTISHEVALLYAKGNSWCWNGPSWQSWVACNREKSPEGFRYELMDPNLVRYMIETNTNEGDWVLDPFCGSSQVGRVARELSRNYIGIDLDPFEVS